MARLTLPRLSGLPGRSLGLVLAAIAGTALLVAVLGVVGFRFDPFDLAGRKLERATAEASQSKVEAAAASIEAAGARDTTTRVEITLAQSAAAQDLANHLSTLTRSAPDANEPLDPARIARLRDFDRQLCAVRPAICPDAPDTAAAKGDAADGPAGLPAGGPATR